MLTPSRVAELVDHIQTSSGQLLPCNPFSVSEATGIPRETVRRKFAQLTKDGYIQKVADRSYIITEKASEASFPDFNLCLFAEFQKLCSELNSVLTHEDKT